MADRNSIHTRPMTSRADESFVVFVIGMRINAFWRISQWLPVLLTMRRVLRDLKRQPDTGFLSQRTRFGGRHLEMIQYWRSFADIHAYARERGGEHLRAWQWFSQTIGDNGSVGLWHECFVIPEHHAETIYLNMPEHGLAEAMGITPIRGQDQTAAGRLRWHNNRDETEASTSRRAPSTAEAQPADHG